MSGWSGTTSSSPRSAPAASSATSKLEHGAVRLTEVLRFTDPAEAAATLALRDGRPEALGFYLDQHRIHVGDQTTLTEDLFTAWQADRSQGLDALMLAPTRELAAELNQRARTHRLTQTRPRQPARRTVALRRRQSGQCRGSGDHPEPTTAGCA